MSDSCLARHSRTADTTEGFFSRWLVIPFTGFFPAGVADTTLIDRLTSQANLQGLLRGAVGGLQNVMRRGSFIIPPSVHKATKQFRIEADPMRAFIDDKVRSDPQREVPRTDVYAEYNAWCIDNNFRPMGATRFYETFISAAVDTFSHDVGMHRRKDGRTIKGISLRG